MRDLRGRGAGRTTRVFGIPERGGRVRCQIVTNCSNGTLTAIRQGKLRPQAKITWNGRPVFCGLVEAGLSRHQRIDTHADANHPIFARKGAHTNRIQRR